jgi:putative heme iron utilization protein
MPYALDERGQPFFLISTMAMHTKNIAGDPRASLLITQPGITGDPLGAARVTIMGTVQRLKKEESSQHRDLYLEKFENAAYWVDFSDFGFYAMTVSDVYYVGGFGAMGWVASEDYQHASVDPLVDSSHSLIEFINQHSVGTLKRIAQRHGYSDIQDTRITAVDYLGFHLRLQSDDRVQGARMAFPSPVSTEEGVRNYINQMGQEA